MDSINGPDAIGWRCARCGHAVPIDNREVHEARCGRAPSPTPTPTPTLAPPQPPPTLLPTPASPSLFDPDEETPTHNVFTPGSPPRDAQTPQQPQPQPQPTSAAAALSRPWREVNLPAAAAAAAVATAREQREQEQRRTRDLRRRLQVLQERSGQGDRPFTSSSSSSSDSGFVFVGPDAGAAGAGAGERAGAGAAAAAAGAGAGGEERESETTWACNACTYLNDFAVSRCAMCGTRMSPQQRPPDSTYRDTLISDDPDPPSRSGGRCRRQAGAAGDFEAAAEEARCRLLAEASARRGNGTRGGGSGGRGGQGNSGGRDDDGLIDTGGAASGAAAGSLLGAISAGMLSAIQPGARPGRVLASALQGALMGGAAGAALGGITDDTGARGGNNTNNDRTEGGRGGRDDEFGAWLRQRRRQRQRQLSLEFVEHSRTGILLGGGRGGGGGGGGELDLDVEESLLLARRMEALNLPDAAAEMRREAMRGTVEGPRGIVHRRRQPHLHEQEEDGATRPASARAIAALPEETLTAGSLSHLKEDGRQCCICLEDFGTGDEVKRLQCLHLYHTVCIQNWLQTSGTCPQCKHRVDLA